MVLRWRESREMPPSPNTSFTVSSAQMDSDWSAGPDVPVQHYHHLFLHQICDGNMLHLLLIIFFPKQKFKKQVSPSTPPSHFLCFRTSTMTVRTPPMWKWEKLPCQEVNTMTYTLLIALNHWSQTKSMKILMCTDVIWNYSVFYLSIYMFYQKNSRAGPHWPFHCISSCSSIIFSFVSITILLLIIHEPNVA